MEVEHDKTAELPAVEKITLIAAFLGTVAEQLAEVAAEIERHVCDRCETRGVNQ